VGILLETASRAKREDEEEISCDTPKYWLEESYALDVPDRDNRMMKLGEIVDDVEAVIKCIRVCNT
jgi:hypothetical protein